MKIIVEKYRNLNLLFQFLFICSFSLFLYWIAIVFDCFLKSMWWRFLCGFVGVFRTWFCICIWICIGLVDVGVCLICVDICIWLCIWDVGVWDDYPNSIWVFFSWDRDILDVGNLLREWSSRGVDNADDWFYPFFLIKFINNGA